MLVVLDIRGHVRGITSDAAKAQFRDVVLPAMKVAVTVSMFTLLLIFVACVVSSRSRRAGDLDSTQQNLLVYREADDKTPARDA